MEFLHSVMVAIVLLLLGVVRREQFCLERLLFGWKILNNHFTRYYATEIIVLAERH
jgi:hypothetical protein